MKWKDLGQAALVLVFTMIVVAGASVISSFLKGEGALNINTPLVITKEPSAYEVKDKMQYLVVMENVKNIVTDHVPTYKDEVHLKVTGLFAKGYLYVVADVAGKPLETKDSDRYDAVFAQIIELTPNGDGRQIGGHLLEQKSLKTQRHDSYTELLFDLSEVPYKKHYLDPDTEITLGNWLEVLNNPTREEILAFSSTEKGVGTVQKLVIYYTCVDGSNCSITKAE
jgi:hypothetical protein